jgi:hypothetical protein
MIDKDLGTMAQLIALNEGSTMSIYQKMYAFLGMVPSQVQEPTSDD